MSCSNVLIGIEFERPLVHYWIGGVLIFTASDNFQPPAKRLRRRSGFFRAMVRTEFPIGTNRARAAER